jgi:hypothetical protein
LDRVRDFGVRLGSNVMEIIAAIAFDRIKIDPVNKYKSHILFIGKDFWLYLFG